MKNVMVDLETFSSRHDAMVVAIGAVEFDDNTIGREFYCSVEPDSRFHISGDTVLWWLEQSDAARASLRRQPRLQLIEALKGFAAWFPKKATLWGNGATFDNVILRNAYNVVGLRPPWHYRDDRCFRTMAAQLPRAGWPEHGTAHDALSDAKAQAQYLISAMKLRA